uniref:Kazal-like domain-containing protein n=1 Tax=Lates calcarifer TaxID=8187 RepID=A0A4W6CXC0_LATCA
VLSPAWLTFSTRLHPTQPPPSLTNPSLPPPPPPPPPPRSCSYCSSASPGSGGTHLVSLHGGTATWGARSRSENGLLSVSERPAEPVGIGVVGARLRLFPTSPVPSGTVRETWVCPWRRRHRSRSPGGCASGAGRREAGSGSPSSRSSPLYLWSSCAPSLPPSATARRRTGWNCSGFDDRDTDLFLCDTNTCKFDGECLRIGNMVTCICDFKCNNDYAPVCGSNNQNYQNECFLRRDACKQQSEVLIMSEGACPADAGSGSGDDGKITHHLLFLLLLLLLCYNSTCSLCSCVSLCSLTSTEILFCCSIAQPCSKRTREL